MTSAINQTVAAPILPTSLSLLNTLNKSTAQGAPAPTSSKGKLFSKTSPILTPSITPTAPPSNETVNLIALIAAMMVAIQAMELSISSMMSKLTAGESQVQSDTNKAVATSNAANVQHAIDVAAAAAKSKKLNGIMSVLGDVAAGLVCLVSLGTLTGVALCLVIAITVLDASGLLQKGIDAGITATGTSTNSTMGKALELVAKIVAMILVLVLTCGAGSGTAAAEESADAAGGATKAAEAGTDAAEAGSDAMEASSDIEMVSLDIEKVGTSAAKTEADLTKLSTDLEKVVTDIEEVEAEAGNVAGDVEKSGSDATKSKSFLNAAQKMAGANMLASLNPLGDLGVLIERAANHGRSDADTEAWIEMATAIASSLAGMYAAFSSGAGETGAATDSVAAGKIIKTLNGLEVCLQLTSAALTAYLADIKLDQSKAEKSQGQDLALTDMLNSICELFQSIAKDQQQWLKETNATNQQLSNSFHYDEFSNFAQVQA